MTHSPHQPKLASGHTQNRPGERVFVIAPLAANPRPANAHRYGGIASGATYLESDPIGLYGGSYSTYAYANGNPVSLVDSLGLCADRKRCEQLRKNIDSKSQTLANKLSKYDPVQDGIGGFPYFGGRRLTIPGSHYDAIQDLQRGLARDLNDYARLLCDQDDDQGPGFGSIANSILDMATQPVPPPQFPQQSAPSVSNQTISAAVLSALLAAAAALALSPQ